MTGVAFARSRIDRLTGCIGAEVSGFDVTRIGSQEIVLIKELIQEHGVLFFRGQSTDPGDLVEFAGRLGPALPAHPLKPGLTGYPAVLSNNTGGVSAADVRSRDLHNRHGTNWHVDCTFMRNVPVYSVLQAVTVPPAGGDTLFADLAGAYQGLSEPLRTLADQLTCRHDAKKVYAAWLDPDADPDLRDRLLALSVVSHPLVVCDQRSGRKSLLLNPNCVTEIEGLSGLESDTMLGLFMSYALVPERTVRWRWAVGDIVVWDNVRLLHNYVLDYGAGERLIRRAMAGSAPLTGAAGQSTDVESIARR